MIRSTSPYRRFQTVALGVGGVALLLALVLAFVSGARPFFESYLLSFMLWGGLSLGCFVLLLVQHLAGGSWGALIRRPLEAGASVLPVMAVLFIPILFGMGALYPWTQQAYLDTHPLVAAKTEYLNVPFFIIRSVLYFAVLLYGVWFFVKQSRLQDERPAEASRIGFRLKRVSGAWIVVFVIVMTFAGIDWGMSITPEFFSGIYSVILMIGQALGAMCLVLFTIVYLASRDPKVNELLTSKRLQDLGNFLMAFTMFWAYTNFSQLIIIWSNNIIETNPYYVVRFSPAWQGVGLFLLFFGFFAPFAILFSRWVKRKRRALLMVAAWAVLIRVLDLYYILVPSFGREGLAVTLSDLLLILGLGGIWLGVYAMRLGSSPTLPLNDPRLMPDAHSRSDHAQDEGDTQPFKTPAVTPHG
jgi:hypothetical protein